MEFKNFFRCLQNGNLSAHTCMQGLAEMCFEDLCRTVECKEDKELIEYFKGDCEERNKELIEMYEYEILVYSEELEEEYKSYWNHRFDYDLEEIEI